MKLTWDFVKRLLPGVPSPRRIMGLMACAYLAVAAFVSMFQTGLIYFPSRLIEATPTAAGLDFDDLMLTAADGTNFNAWYVPHSSAKATILFFHGNGGNNGDRVDALRVLHSLGFNVMIVDYRGYGKSEGRPTERGTYLDAAAAWKYLTEVCGAAEKSIVVMGESLGGAVAIDLASRHAPGCLVVQSTFTRLADVAAIHYPFLPVRWLLRHRYDSIDKIGRVSCPKLFIHSTEDTLIPIANGRALFEAAPKPKMFLSTPGDHNDGGFLYSGDHTAKLKEFLALVFP